MKKYVKPELFYERFELSQQIAACDYDSKNTLSDETCSFEGMNKDFGVSMKIFMTVGPDGPCDVIADSYCYHNANSSAYGIFNS